MVTREEFHDKLLQITPNVYFNPPTNQRMSYPCIRYKLDRIDNTHADDQVYTQDYAYATTVIDRNPDSQIAKEVSKFPRAAFSRQYVADNLYHWVYRIY